MIDSWVVDALNWIVHGFIVLGAFLGAGLVVYVVLSGGSSIEKLFRTVAALAGLLLFFLSKAVNMSVPEVLLRSFSSISSLELVLGLLAPAVVGALAGHVLYRAFLRTIDETTTRFIVMVFVLLLSVFSDVYVASLNLQSSTGVNRLLLPNGSFLLGLALRVMLIRVRPSAKKGGQW